MKDLMFKQALLSALGTREFTLTIVLVIFVMLTALLLLIIILLCASKSFRAFFFREAAAKRKKAAKKKKPTSADGQADEQLPATPPATAQAPIVTSDAPVQTAAREKPQTKPRAPRRSKESKMEHDLFESVLTVPLGGFPAPDLSEEQSASASRSRASKKRGSDTYDNIPTVAIPATNSRSQDESTKNTFTVTITRARAASVATKKTQSGNSAEKTAASGKAQTNKK